MERGATKTCGMSPPPPNLLAMSLRDPLLDLSCTYLDDEVLDDAVEGAALVAEALLAGGCGTVHIGPG